MRRKFAFAVFALVLRCVLMYAQTGNVVPRAYDPNSPKHTVSGSVINSATGEPIPRALVQIMGPMQQAGLTDSQGSFRFEGVSEGRAVFLARKPGFFSSEELSRGGGRPRSAVTINADISSLVLKLTPEGIVTGTITGEDGEPLENVQVRFKRQMVMNGRKQWTEGSQARTDENGEFRASNLIPGTYYLIADALRKSTPRAAAEPNIGYPQTYFPGALDLSSASPIEVRGGQSVQVDLRLRAQPVYEVSGVITGIPVGQSPNLQFTSRSGDYIAAGVQYIPDQGTFSSKVPAGNYVIRAHTFGPQRLTASATITVAGNVSGLRLPLQAGTTIPVVVRTDFTKQQSAAISNAGLRKSDAPQYVTVELMETDSGTTSAYSTIDPKDSNAPASVRNAAPGRYRVQIRPHGPWYVQSATIGQTDLLREELVVGQGGEQRPIEVLLRDDGGSISGTVTSDNNPVAATVLVVAERRATPPQVQNASERGFTVSNLAPGDYMLFAFDSTDGLEYTNREALESYASQAAHVSVNSNGSSNVTLKLIRRGEP